MPLLPLSVLLQLDSGTQHLSPSNKTVAVECRRMRDGDDTARVLTSDAISDSFAALILHMDPATSPAA